MFYCWFFFFSFLHRIALYGTNFSPESISLNTGRARTSYRSRTMKEKLLREGGIIEAVDDMDGSTPTISESHGGRVNEPVYSMTSAHQTYSLTSLSAIGVEEGGARGQVQGGGGYPQPSWHRVTPQGEGQGNRESQAFLS